MLKLKYAKKEDIPEGYEALYTEKDGAWVLTGVDGLKTADDMQTVNDLLTAERKITKELKEKIAALGDSDADKIGDLVTLLGELGDDFSADTYRNAIDEAGKLRKQIAGGGDSETVINSLREELAEANRNLGQTRKELTSVKRKSEENQSLAEGLQTKLNKGTIRQAVISAATELKVAPSAFEDAVLLAQNVFELDANSNVVAKDGLSDGVIAGTTPSDWLRDLQQHRPHWWPNSQGAGGAGGGAGGGYSGKNPWKSDSLNLTEQGRLVKEQPQLAKSLAKEAGVELNV